MQVRTLHTKMDRCHKCSLRDGCVRVVGSNRIYFDWEFCKLMIVGYHPSAHDELLGEAFSKDLNGNFLRQSLIKVGLRPNDVYMTHLIKCRPVIEEIGEAHLAECKHWLWAQILDLKPSVVVTLGLEVSNFVLKQERTMGKMIGKFYILPKTDGITQIAPWYNLDYTIGRPSLVDGFIEFLKKVKERLC